MVDIPEYLGKIIPPDAVTRDAVLALSGRDLDARVATAVMGLDVRRSQTFGRKIVYTDESHTILQSFRLSEVENYSSDGNAMLAVLARLLERKGIEVYLTSYTSRVKGKVTNECEIALDGIRLAFADADTLPVAVARAALLATLEDVS